MNRARKDRPGRKLPAHELAPDAPEGYDPLRHNYLVKQLRLFAEGKLPLPAPGKVRRVEIAHDAGCALLVQGGYCDCDPIIRVRE